MSTLPERLANLRAQARVALLERHQKDHDRRAKQLELLRAWIHSHIGSDMRVFLDWGDLNELFAVDASELILTFRFPESWPIEQKIGPSLDNGWHIMRFRESPEDGPDLPIYRIIRWPGDLARQEALFACSLGTALALAEMSEEEKEQFGGCPPY